MFLKHKQKLRKLNVSKSIDNVPSGASYYIESMNAYASSIKFEPLKEDQLRLVFSLCASKDTKKTSYSFVVPSFAINTLLADVYELEFTDTEDSVVKAPTPYHVKIKGQWVDVYDVLEAFQVEDQILGHLIKKALRPGKRGHKSELQDYQDIEDSAKRANQNAKARNQSN